MASLKRMAGIEASFIPALFMRNMHLLVKPKNTTQTCSNCGYVCRGNTRITLGKEEWDCPNCGAHHIRDYNAGKNILATGLAILKESGVSA